MVVVTLAGVPARQMSLLHLAASDIGIFDITNCPRVIEGGISIFLTIRSISFERGCLLRSKGPIILSLNRLWTSNARCAVCVCASCSNGQAMSRSRGGGRDRSVELRRTPNFPSLSRTEVRAAGYAAGSFPPRRATPPGPSLPRLPFVHIALPLPRLSPPIPPSCSDIIRQDTRMAASLSA